MTPQHPLPPVRLAELHRRIGQETGVSRWIVVDQKRIDGLAETTGDRQFIHVDPVGAADSPFGTTIAHGLLTLSLMGEMKSICRRSQNQPVCNNNRLIRILHVLRSDRGGRDKIATLFPRQRTQSPLQRSKKGVRFLVATCKT